MLKLLTASDSRLRVIAAVLGFALAGCGAGSATLSPNAGPASAPPPVSATVSISPSTASVNVGGVPLQFSATITNAANNGITWAVNGVVGGDTASGTISASGLYLSPSTLQSSAMVRVTATSTADPTQSATATLTLIEDVPVSVTVAPASVSLQAGVGSQTFIASVAGTNNSAVTWQVNGVTGGNATVGTITAGGVYTAPTVIPAQPTVTVTAISAADAQKSASASVTITATPPAMSVSVTPATANVALGTGTQAFTAVVSNSTNTAVTWQVNNITGGNASVGTISATGVYTAPKALPSSTSIAITAISSADTSKTGSAIVTITVPPPTIGGSPTTSVVVGQAYYFKPTASDPNGLPLTFSITGKPSWATFNATTGELAGTPAAANVGSSSIAITASNGKAQATLSFTLAVVQSATGSASLSWVAPTTRTDGSALTDLAGFRIYYGNQQGNLTSQVAITNPTVTTAVVSNLASGTWYFVVTAVDSSGGESAYSNIGSKTI